MRLIDADKLSEKTRTVILKNGAAFDCVEIIDIIEAPAVEARHVRRGRWVNREVGAFIERCCSNCGCVDEECNFLQVNFCPNCGADMREHPDPPHKLNTI